LDSDKVTKIILRNFNGGINRKARAEHIKDNELACGENADLSTLGVVKRFSGVKKMNLSAMANAITHMFMFNPNNTNEAPYGSMGITDGSGFWTFPDGLLENIMADVELGSIDQTNTILDDNGWTRGQGSVSLIVPTRPAVPTGVGRFLVYFRIFTWDADGALYSISVEQRTTLVHLVEPTEISDAGD